MPELSPVSLQDDHVLLEPLDLHHTSDLEAAAADGELWNLWFTSAPAPGQARAYVEKALEGLAATGRIIQGPERLERCPGAGLGHDDEGRPRTRQPRDLQVAGILAEVSGDTVVIGIGLNVSTRPDELPEPAPARLPATSIYAEGLRTGRPVVLDRVQLLSGILLAFERRCVAWRSDHGKVRAIRPEYRELCVTIGRDVRVEDADRPLLERVGVATPAVDADPIGESLDLPVKGGVVRLLGERPDQGGFGPLDVAERRLGHLRERAQRARAIVSRNRDGN